MLSRSSHVQLFVNLRTVAHQAPLSMDSAGKNTGVGCHALLSGIFPTQRLNPCHMSPALTGTFFISESPGKPARVHYKMANRKFKCYHDAQLCICVKYNIHRKYHDAPLCICVKYNIHRQYMTKTLFTKTGSELYLVFEL